MQGLNKKGFSSVLQITLLTFLSVLALSLVWGYVSDLSNNFENQLSPAVDCISQKSKINGACLNSDGKIELSLDTGLGEKISYLDINFKGESFACGQMCGSCNLLDENGKKTIYLSPQSPVSLQDQIATAINKCLPELFSISSC